MFGLSGLVYLVSFVQPKNQTDQINQMDQTNQHSFSTSCQRDDLYLSDHLSITPAGLPHYRNHWCLSGVCSQGEGR
jgi:preprotein translocase subunit Sec63